MPSNHSIKTIDYSSLLKIKLSIFLEEIKNFPLDYQKYCEIRDKLLNCKNYEPLNIVCKSCKETNHTIFDCPYIHHKPLKNYLIHKYNFQFIQLRKKFNRKIKKNKTFIKNNCEERMLIYENSESDESDENEIYMQNFNKIVLDNKIKASFEKIKGFLNFSRSLHNIEIFKERHNEFSTSYGFEEKEFYFEIIKNFDNFFIHNNIKVFI